MKRRITRSATAVIASSSSSKRTKTIATTIPAKRSPSAIERRSNKSPNTKAGKTTQRPSSKRTTRVHEENTITNRATATAASNTATATKATPSSSMSLGRGTIRTMIEDKILKGSNNIDAPSSANVVVVNTKTLGGWCLVDALLHCGTASNGILEPLIKEHGPPAVYIDYLREKLQNSTTNHRKQPDNSTATDFPSFRALCRTVAGQQLAGAAVNTIWRRLMEAVIGRSIDHDMDEMGEYTDNAVVAFTPKAVLRVVVQDNDGDTEPLRKAAGLSRAKCNCVLAIARSFESGHLSEELLRNGSHDDLLVRERLLSIKGLGPWSVDMFLLFRCHKSDILPIGDLALRSGTGILFNITSSAGKGKPLDAKKDAAAITSAHAPFEPYRSISSYYMYKVADAAKIEGKGKKNAPTAKGSANKKGKTVAKP